MSEKQNNGAKFSECGKHRLLLWRIWDDKLPLIMFIGLNPSTANADTDDNTIRRVKGIAKALGYGGIYMTNLFTYISTDPNELDMINGNHADADYYLTNTAYCSAKVVAAWGNFKVFGRDNQVKKLISDMSALHINKNGSPKHPLYCRKEVQLIDYHCPF